LNTGLAYEEVKIFDAEVLLRKQFLSALSSTKIRGIRFHKSEHINVDLRIESGQNIKYTQSQLGHASINITLDIYGHLFNDANFNRQQVKLLEASFKSVRNPLENTQKSQTAIAVNL
jgi:integrase